MRIKYSVKVTDQNGDVCVNHKMQFTATKMGTINGGDVSNPSSDYNTAQIGTTDSTGTASVYYSSDSQKKYPTEYTIQDITTKGKLAVYNLTLFTYLESDGTGIAPTVKYMASIVNTRYNYKVIACQGSSLRTTVSGATISCNNSSVITNSSGIATFTANTASATVTASKTISGHIWTGSTTANGTTGSSPSTYFIHMYQSSLDLSSQYNFSYYVWVKNQIGEPIKNANVSFFGMTVETNSVMTDTSGLAHISYTRTITGSTSIPPSDLPSQYTVTKGGYVTITNKLATLSKTPISGLSQVNTYYSYNTGVTDESVTIQGICYDASTAAALSGVTFTIYYGAESASTATTVAKTNSLGYYSADIMKDPAYWKYEFTKTGYVAESNTLFGNSLPRFTEDVRWDQILWKGNLPENVDTSCAYKEWLIANRGENFGNLPENIFQMVKYNSLNGEVSIDTSNITDGKQIVSKKNIGYSYGNAYRFILNDYTSAYNGLTLLNLKLRNGDVSYSSGITFSENSNGDYIIKTILKNDVPYGWSFNVVGRENVTPLNGTIKTPATVYRAETIANYLADALWQCGIKMSYNSKKTIATNLVRSGTTTLYTSVYNIVAKINEILKSQTGFTDLCTTALGIGGVSFRQTPAIGHISSTLKAFASNTPFGGQDASSLFASCQILSEINWSNIGCTISQFDNFCSNAESLQIVRIEDTAISNSKRDSSSSFTYAFSDCTSLHDVILGYIFGPDLFSGDLDSMFTNCRSLETITFKGIDTFINSGTEMFYGCYNLKRIDFVDCTDDFIQEIYNILNDNSEPSFGVNEPEGNLITLTVDEQSCPTVELKFVYNASGYYDNVATPLKCNFSLYLINNNEFYLLHKGTNESSYTTRVAYGDKIAVAIDSLPIGYHLPNGSTRTAKEFAASKTVGNTGLTWIFTFV